MIDLKPFNEFWINCMFNAKFSIITSIDKSLIDAAYINCYTYIQKTEVTPCGTPVKYLKLKNSDDKQLDFLTSVISTTPVEYRNQPNMLERIIDLLKSNFLFIGVDLYYWLPNTICWERYHWEHYSLIKKYDAQKNVFITLDENSDGFEECEVPAPRFEIAVTNSPMKVDGYIITYNDNIDKYSINYDEILDHARRLIKELGELYCDIWTLSNNDIKEGHMFDLFSIYAYQIANRQKANIKLTDRLKCLNLISLEKHTSIVRRFEELSTGWALIKGEFMKGNMSYPKKLDCEKLNNLKNSLILKEIETWKLLLVT